MKAELTCPVCDRSEITTDICPNCETDLTLVRMLAELTPSQPQINQSKSLFYRVILILCLGICLGVAGNFVVAKLPITANIAPTPTSVVIPNLSTPKPTKVENKINPCTGNFYYKVKSGDYPWLIAKNFYGNGELNDKITQANPRIKNKDLVVGDILIIPSLEENCHGNI
ncbi:MAG TPA: LysM peptidoglycan-binding domain-containing protein [Nostocaceae cyanobacterium]|nr:LysM peptidoglycan-binding domain-containing protein [Nostocaceae cyanobacterium]